MKREYVVTSKTPYATVGTLAEAHDEALDAIQTTSGAAAMRFHARGESVPDHTANALDWVITGLWKRIQSGLGDRVELQERVVSAIQARHGVAVLGVITIHDHTRCPIWEWPGDPLDCHRADYVLAAYDAELLRLVLARDAMVSPGVMEDQAALEPILNRIRALGGDFLRWK